VWVAGWKNGVTTGSGGGVGVAAAVGVMWGG